MSKEENPAVFLEAILDKQGLHNVLSMLESIAYDKAAHVETDWYPETRQAKDWVRAAKKIGKLRDTFFPNTLHGGPYE
jgi:hypothetical protein